MNITLIYQFLILTWIGGFEAKDKFIFEFIDELILGDEIGEVFQSPISKFRLKGETLFFSTDNPVSISAFDLKTGSQVF